MASSQSSEVIQHCHGHSLVVGIGFLFTMSNIYWGSVDINSYCANINMSVLLLSFVVSQYIEVIFSSTRAIKVLVEEKTGRRCVVKWKYWKGSGLNLVYYITKLYQYVGSQDFFLSLLFFISFFWRKLLLKTCTACTWRLKCAVSVNFCYARSWLVMDEVFCT